MNELIAKRDSGSDRRPLYVRIRAVILERIQTGVWKPAEALPSEMALGRELGVSQGTVRKALDSLVADQLLVRRQGLGTFVADHTSTDVLFRFFKIYTAGGDRVTPESRDLRVRRAGANEREAALLRIPRKSTVIRIARTRLADGKPIIHEMLSLPAAKFPELGADGVVPNTLYDLFQHRYGITVSHADERLSAVAARASEAQALGVERGAPLLKIDRLTYGLDQQPIEWRVSLCHLKGLHYLAELR